nr:hypothetical protein [Nitrosomonas nitrosa]
MRDGRAEKKLEQQLWAIANDLRGKMHADEFRDFAIGSQSGPNTAS